MKSKFRSKEYIDIHAYVHRQTHIVHRDINKSTETHSRYIEIYLQTQTYIGTYMHRNTYINNLTPGLSIKREFFF